MKLTNKCVIIVPVYNAKDLIIPCISSILEQDYNDLGLIIRDDLSTDGTTQIIEDYLSMNHSNNNNIIYIKNKRKMYPVGNTYESVLQFIEDQNTVVGVVDGDDSLIRTDAVSKIMEVYNKGDKWLVWSQHQNTDGSIGQSMHLPPDHVIHSNRNYWSVSHFRTSRAFLFHKIKKIDIIDPFVPESYYSYSGDAAFLFPFIEMCGNEKSHFLNEVLYLYNNNLPTNEHHKSLQNAIKYGQYIRNYGKKYSKLESQN